MLLKVLLSLCFIGIAYGNNYNTESESFAFAPLFQDNMVLQREPKSARIWGFGSPDAAVVVALGEDTYTTSFEEKLDTYIWMVNLPPQQAGGPHVISATQTSGNETSTIELRNILFGDVWVCSGQSNMVLTMPNVENSDDEIDAATRPNIRIMTVRRADSVTPQLHLPILQNWTSATPESIGGSRTEWDGYSAVCWFFGRDVYDETGIPIGLVTSAWGATAIEPWMSKSALEACNIVQDPDETTQAPEDPNAWYAPTNHSGLWNAMIFPMLNMSIKGVVWYQGENNVGYNSYQYKCTFPSLIRDWRDAWQEGTASEWNHENLFPFGFVQLSTNHGIDTSYYPLLRWRQSAEYGYVPNPQMPQTFMAVAMDLGEPPDSTDPVHPRYKQDVGARLALGALETAYGHDVNPQGPLPLTAELTDDFNVLLTYPDDQTLVFRNQDTSNFEVCCNTSACLLEDRYNSGHWSKITMVESSSLADYNYIKIDAGDCYNAGQSHAAVVRYGWSLHPCELRDCLVYNDKGLPAPPFVMQVTDRSSNNAPILGANFVLISALALGLTFFQF